MKTRGAAEAKGLPDEQIDGNWIHMVTVVFKEPRSDSPLEEFEVFGHVREPDDGYVTAVQKFHRSKRADAERYALTLMQRLQADDFERC